MKPKNCTLTLLLILINSISFAQLRVDEYGRIGMGTNHPNSEFKCHIKGDLLLTTFPEIPAGQIKPVELRMVLGIHPNIGSGTGSISFWAGNSVGYNILYAKSFYTQSDSTTKKNIKPINDGLKCILGLKPCSYQFKSDSLSHHNGKKYGFLAQEVKEILPEITDTLNGLMLVDYNQIIPLLVDAVKEQCQTIDSLKQEIKDFKNEFSYCCAQENKREISGDRTNNSGNSKSTALESKFNQTTIGILYQNNPNPFSEQTKIKYAIKTNMTNASIMVFDMQGILQQTIPIYQSGKGEVIINGNKLPAGMYLYSLIVDNKEIDTKRMILAN
jgi:hypothetical protein